MNTTLTVADVAPILNRYAGNDLIGRINQVLDRLNNSGLWKGTLNRSILGIGTQGRGFITLARGDESIVGVDIGGVPRTVRSEFYEYSPSGYGYIPEEQYSCGPLVDMGDGFVTQANITGIVTLRLKLEDPADAGKTVRFYGKDESGREIYSATGHKGTTLTTVSPSADTMQIFTEITGLQFQFMQGYSTLWQVIDGVETQIGVYAPGEMRPCYRRYKTGVIQDSNCNCNRIQVLSRRRFIPLVAPTDWIIPGNIGALKMGLQALTLEDAGTISEAEVCWGKATQLLDQELSALRGSAQTTIKITMDSAPYNGYFGYGYGAGGFWGGGYNN